MLPGSLAAARARHPVLDHGLTGVLAVAVASPCTAPFMGAALGAALALPAAQALAVFAALGVGHGRALPGRRASGPGSPAGCPGPARGWSASAAAMAFPMFATVVWLVWVLGQQAGIDAAAALLGAAARDRLRALAARRSPARGRGARTRGRGGGRGHRRERGGLVVADAALRAGADARPRPRRPRGRQRRLAALVDRTRWRRRAPRAGRCSSTSPPPGASPARSTSAPR